MNFAPFFCRSRLSLLAKESRLIVVWRDFGRRFRPDNRYCQMGPAAKLSCFDPEAVVAGGRAERSYRSGQWAGLTVHASLQLPGPHRGT